MNGTWFKPAYTLFLKTGPACNAGCNSCPSGRKNPGDTEKIPLMKAEMFERVLNRIGEQANIVSVVLHYYNEPTLNPHMPEMIKLAVERGIPTLMSTNGSYPENLARCMQAGLRNLIFSVSGWTQAVHERSHKHTDIDTIKRSMETTAEKLRPGQFVRVGWHDYLYNRHEQEQMRAFAERLGFKFTPYQTSLLPLDAALQRIAEIEGDPNSPEHQGERDLLTKMTEAKQLCFERRHFTCIYQQRMVAVDGNGMLYSCAARTYGENMRESVFEICIEEFNRRRLRDASCNACKAVGGHVYGMQKYREPLTVKNAVVRKAEDAWRSLGLGARFPKMGAKIGEWLYERPEKKTSRT